MIGAIFYGLYNLGNTVARTPPVTGVLWYVALINWLLAGFNLVSAFPLDGGRVLRSILWKVKGNLRWATRIASRVGVGFGIFLIVMGLFRVLAGNFIGGMWFFLIGLFIQNAANMSYRQLIARKALEGESLNRFIGTGPGHGWPRIARAGAGGRLYLSAPLQDVSGG